MVSKPIANMQSVGDCAQKCTVVPGCNGFHYYGKTDIGYGACYLKSEVTKIQTNLADDRVRYGGICSPRGILCIYYFCLHPFLKSIKYYVSKL